MGIRRKLKQHLHGETEMTISDNIFKAAKIASDIVQNGGGREKEVERRQSRYLNIKDN